MAVLEKSPQLEISELELHLQLASTQSQGYDDDDDNARDDDDAGDDDDDDNNDNDKY